MAAVNSMNDDDSSFVERKLLLAFTSSSSSDSDIDCQETPIVVQDDEEDEDEVVVVGISNRKRILCKQLSMRETSREAKWENRRRQIINRRRQMTLTTAATTAATDNEIDLEEEERRRRSKVRSLTDEDLDELRGSIELGFGFNEENGGHNLCDTLPALDLYFAVNRQLSDPKLRLSPSPASTPTVETPSPMSPEDDQRNSAEWKICNPGDNPQAVKMRLRHWAQAVACSVRQCC